MTQHITRTIRPRTHKNLCAIKAQERRMSEETREIVVPWDDAVRVICGGFFLAAMFFLAWAVLP